MKRFFERLLAGAWCLLVLGALAGCDSCKPGKPGPIGRYTVEVGLDDSLKDSSVLVDIVGVNPMGLPRWESYDMGKYWQAGDSLRHDADKITMSFVSGQALSQTVTNKDPHWDKWKAAGVTQLLILADLPGEQESRPGNQDARRQILSLDRCNWPSGTTKIKLLVQHSGISVVTSPRVSQ
jgi:hypothetical protein